MIVPNLPSIDITKLREQIWTRYKSENIRQAVLSYAENLESQDLPIIFGLRGIAQHTSIKSQVLSAITYKTDDFYRTFQIPKRSGDFRTIVAPYPVLLEVQRWIASKILSKIKIHSAAHGFVPGRSIISNASQHLGNKYLLMLDIKDFFPSISLLEVRRIFYQLGYSRRVSSLLARLCCLDGKLPQGAATSPTLSNIKAINLDEKLSNYANSLSITYSRYADDMAFSWNNDQINPFINIDNLISSCGFDINPKKSRLAGPTERKVITGISITSGRLCLPKSTKRLLRQDAHLLLRRGLNGSLTRPEFLDPIFAERLQGRLQFWRQVEPNNHFVVEALSSINSMLSESYFTT